MLNENVGKVDEMVVELTVNSDPKELRNGIHRLKALLFIRDEEIKKLKGEIDTNKKVIKQLKRKKL